MGLRRALLTAGADDSLTNCCLSVCLSVGPPARPSARPPVHLSHSRLSLCPQGLAKKLPFNQRASGLAQACGYALSVSGDCFIARVFDDENDFRRIDFSMSEVCLSLPLSVSLYLSVCLCISLCVSACLCL